MTVPRASEHHEKYLQNRAFLYADKGLAGTQPAWAAVVAFYSALHLVERLAARQNIHHVGGGAHARRFRYLAAHPHHRVIVSDYDLLRKSSEIARYGTARQFLTHHPGDFVQVQLVDARLVAVEQYVAAVFAPPAGP